MGKSSKRIGWLLAACVLGALPVWAHHAASNFDQSKQYIFRGAVKTFMWANPHAFLYVNVAKADGSTELWGFETDGPNMLIRAGINANMFKEGDKVTVYAAPERDPKKHNGFLAKVVLANGREVMPNGGGLGQGPLPPGSAPEGGGPPPGLPGFRAAATPVEYK